MKPENLNPKAREAFGKSLIDIGVAIFKALMLLTTVVPIAALFKAASTSPSKSVSFEEILSPLSGTTGFLLILFMGCSFLLGGWLRQEGIRHIHEIEEDEKNG
jgi:hypothetical protein